jgi:2-dehydro-3-deoxygluconokinase
MADFVSFGEVLMRFSAPDAQVLSQASNMDLVYGGSEANVAAALAQWGTSSSHVTQLPDHSIGMAAKQSLISYGVNAKHIIHQPGRIGIYFLEHGAAMRAPKVIYDRFNSSFEHLNPSSFNWDEILEGARWFHWSGITPAISASAAQACKDAIRVARKKNITISGDINYRRVLWNYGKSPKDIMPELIAQCDWVIGGITDFENCIGLSEKTEIFEQACAEIQKKHQQVRFISTTHRTTFNASHNNLQGLLWNGKKIWASKVYDIQPIIDRIGSGDAFMAGLVQSALNEKSESAIIEFATAAAAYKHTIPGDVLMATVTEIESVMEEKNIGKLLR